MRQPAAPVYGDHTGEDITRYSTFSAGGQEQPDDMLFWEYPLRYCTLKWKFLRLPNSRDPLDTLTGHWATHVTSVNHASPGFSLRRTTHGKGATRKPDRDQLGGELRILSISDTIIPQPFSSEVGVGRDMSIDYKAISRGHPDRINEPRKNHVRLMHSAIRSVITCLMRCAAIIICLPGHAGYFASTESLSFFKLESQRSLPRPRFSLR
ncbi:hypothetical protein P153DRAFT_401620 [Dothidotthia symphoricarpi CBS 119687]|uniref:Uncharacterized protein n=1 Tax=Dothidotthia symphoricarpi CBS 119687 TaxID=1392245 RepID=A0A6A5ZYW2_9PLEO|nr:uncharacterized protein P153DRAFT_401620 [Dothidotthia symphoricarpi CBS 119687]KAF2124084.1 hypothetical protein P153DRAFT_401620 [Dothidotthia symphoricarpi CBS 119687]